VVSSSIWGRRKVDLKIVNFSWTTELVPLKISLALQAPEWYFGTADSDRI